MGGIMRLAGAFVLSVLTAAACMAQTRPPQTVTPVTVSGKQSQVGFVWALDPDCSSRGETESRVLRKPEHGTLEITPGNSFPKFPENSPLFHCNKQKVSGSLILYKSNEGYTGKDYFDIEFIGPRGADYTMKYVVTVK
jgi:hypothetical protein